MFDHLDDPQPFVPDAALHEGAVRRGRRLRRRRRLVAGSLATVAVLVVGAAGAAAVVDRKLDDVQRIDVANVPDHVAAGAPQTLLFVGADGGEELPDGPARPGPWRSDTIVVARLDPTAHALVVPPLPRDLWVDVPGHGPDRINQALLLGGPDLLIDTIRANLGIRVDRYLETDFDGAVAMTDALGGLPLRVTTPLRDAQTGLRIDAPGCVTFDGKGLLQLGRSRHLRYLEDGVWKADPRSDLGRIDRQQAIGAALLARLTDLDATDAPAFVRLVDVAVAHLRIDAGTTSTDLVRLFRSIAGARPQSLRLPVTDAVHEGAAVLELADGADRALAAFEAGPDAPPTPPAHGGMPDFGSVPGTLEPC